MPRTRIKICGVTHPDDARLAADAGADAVGMILHAAGARRAIDMATAEHIVFAVPPYTSPVGVFVDADPDELQSVSARLRLRHVQLHGNESPRYVALLRDLTVIKAVKLQSRRDTTLWDWGIAISDGYLRHLTGILVDAVSPTAAGGTGRENDWNVVQHACGEAAGLLHPPSIIVAGGLTPENVAGVVRRLRPYGVDVSSGVEGDTYGRKDAGKVRAFVEAVRAADADLS